jgi:hypothetical protein
VGRNFTTAFHVFATIEAGASVAVKVSHILETTCMPSASGSLSTQDSDSTWIASLGESPGTIGGWNRSAKYGYPYSKLWVWRVHTHASLQFQMSASWGFSAGSFERNVHLG